MFQTIPNDPKVEFVTFTPIYSAICKVGKKPFWGEVKIEYMPKEELIEFESFEAWLSDATLAEPRTIEGVARLVFDGLRTVLGDIPLSVKVSGGTTVHAPATAQITQGFGDND